MLDIELIHPTDVAGAASIFHRDGFVAVEKALTPEQLTYAQSGAKRVIAEQMAATPLEDANRGHARYSFGSQMHHPEWTQLIDLPTILPIVEKIWGSSDFICSGGGGDYSAPGARIQHLHSDIRDVFNDPLDLVKINDVPTPYIVVNFLMVAFREINGAIRFVPGTQRSRHPTPTLQEEPERMRRSIICAPAGTAVIRDVRCWHGGTANNSDEIRPMTSVGYLAPWFRLPNIEPSLPTRLYEPLTRRAKRLCRFIVQA